MDRYVVVSTNNNPDYLFFAPYIEKAWNYFGWQLCIVITNDVIREDIKTINPKTKFIRIQDVEYIRSETISQVGRLYAANFFKDDVLLMTSDIDLLPLADYWNPDPNNVTVYGHDLTWHSFYPMGYVAMTAGNWKKYLNLNGETEAELQRDAKLTGLPYLPDWESWWNHDWTLLTQRLKPYHDKLTLIDRGQIQIAGATLAKGRIDRYNWNETQNQDVFIDAHCHNNNVYHESKMNDFLTVFEKFHGKLNT